MTISRKVNALFFRLEFLVFMEHHGIARRVTSIAAEILPQLCV